VEYASQLEGNGPSKPKISSEKRGGPRGKRKREYLKTQKKYKRNSRTSHEGKKNRGRGQDEARISPDLSEVADYTSWGPTKIRTGHVPGQEKERKKENTLRQRKGMWYKRNKV